jgi:M6 family metalloprotease-like protein
MKIGNKLWLACIALCINAGNATAQTTQEIRGLTVVVHSPDAPFPQSADSVDMMMDQPGFKGWGNNGSVRDFYLTQSAGKVLLTNTTIKVNLPDKDLTNLSYYINQQYPAGFQNLTIDPATNEVVMFTVLTMHGGRSWAFGPQGTQHTVKNNGLVVQLGSGNLTNYTVGQKPENATIIHELGHCIWKWPDHYATAWSNLGNYCNMGMGGDKNSPRAINPGSRLQLGWITNVIQIGHRSYDTTITAVSNSYTTVYKYTNPSNPKEYLLIQPQRYDGQYYQQYINNFAVADQGLSIWYVDEDGGIDLPGEEEDFRIKLVQADNLDELHDEDSSPGYTYLTPTTGYSNVSGDFDDMYDDVKNSFPNGTPFRWKDGGEFGLFITNISAPGPTMTFTVKARANTFIARSDKNGTISPKGVINSINQVFTFTPKPGYEINTVKVDGATVTPTGNQYTLTGSASVKTIEVAFKRKVTQTQLPSGWSKSDLGTVSSTGFAAPATDAIYVESYGTTMAGYEDHGTFVYKTLNGDGTIITRLADNNIPTRRKNKIGLMIRSSLDLNAPMALFARVPYSGITFEYRTANGNAATGATSRDDLHMFELYNWLKMTRSGDNITTYSSRDGITWKLIGTKTLSLPSQIYIGLSVTGSKDGYAARATFDNIQVTNSVGCTLSGTKLSGTSIGTPDAWGGSDATRDKAFDGNITTYFDGPQSVSWTGLDLGSGFRVTGIKFVPREGLTQRMIDGKFQGSNTPDFSAGVTDLHVVTTDPVQDWNCAQVSNTSAFRYIRYIGPVGGLGNVSEIEFFGFVAPANLVPTVTITSPASNSGFAAPANITINATASDTDGSIVKVEFYAGVNYLNRDTTYPYSTTISNLPSGIYSFTAKAFDNLGATSEFTVSNIQVGNNTAPVVSITSPVTNQSFAAPATITINTDVTDAEGNVLKVDFYNGSALLGTDFTAPYSYTWNNVPAGVYNITALATDNLGASSSSTRNNIAVVANTAPTISITSPVTNQSFAAPASITINTNVNDAENNISKVEFYVGSTMLGSDLTAPYSYTWNNVPAGVYNITALVTDSYNATASSTRNNIAVIANTAPTISITSPVTNQSFTAPANITITTNVSDAENNITKVDFYNGSTLLGSDLTAPYSYTWNNVPAGVYNITALVTDSYNATASSTRNNIAVVANTSADITGPACAGNNQTLTYELAPSKRVNANNYGWYFTGSTQTFTPSGYQATLVTGSNYGAGQLCVGVSFSGPPYYTTYCITVPKCSGVRMSETESEWIETTPSEILGFPNPFDNEVTLNLPSDYETASIEVFNANGIKVLNTQVTGSYTFGNELISGIYFVKISSLNKTETIKVVKK